MDNQVEMSAVLQTYMRDNHGDHVTGLMAAKPSQVEAAIGWIYGRELYNIQSRLGIEVASWGYVVPDRDEELSGDN